MSHRSNDCRIYVGNLPSSVENRDLEDIFRKFGKINFIDLKNRRGPAFAFIEFEDPRDAEDAVQARDGYLFDNSRLRVEFPRGNGPSRGTGGSSRSRGRGQSTRRSQFRVLVSGLPSSGSWQDLKDHMREAGDVCYADVNRDGTGVVEFNCLEDMMYAVKKLNDTRFRSHEGEISYIRVKKDGGRSRSRSRSYSPYKARGSPAYSPSPRFKSRSYSRSRSRSRS